MRLNQIRYGNIGRTSLAFIAIHGQKTIMILEDIEEMIDLGFYHIVPFTGMKFKDTFALVGANVSVYDELNIERSACVFHGGDTHEDTIGCPLVGTTFHFDGSTPNIDGGAEAMKILRMALRPDHTHYVNITERF